MTIEEMKNKKRELGYTIEQLAALSGVPAGTVSKIFSGETKSPRYETIRRLEKVLAPVPRESRGIDPYMGSLAAEPQTFSGNDYYSYRKQHESSYKKLRYSEYAPVPVSNRLGIAAGRFKVPDDSFFYDDEIAEMFEDI